MMQFDPELVRVMRAALEEVMQRVPVEYSNQATKAYLAECILKTAGQGRTSFDALVTAAADHMPTIPNLFSSKGESSAPINWTQFAMNCPR
jgi:hypothetical protein